MESGRYKVVDGINIYICGTGQLKIPEGKIVEVKEDGSAYVDGERISIRLLELSMSHLRKVL